MSKEPSLLDNTKPEVETPTETLEHPPVVAEPPAATGTGISVGNITDMDLDEMDAHFAAIDAKRKRIQEWLGKHFIRGVHYGVPPGCGHEVDQDGYYTNRGKRVHISEYKPKDTLYKAGALLACDLFGVVARVALEETLTAAAAKEGQPTLVFRAQLCKSETVFVEGVGSCTVGEKSFDTNQAVKQAEKRALVDAVLKLPFMSDLFEAEEFQPEALTPPPENPDAAETPTRPERAEQENSGAEGTPDWERVKKLYIKQHPDADKNAFWSYVRETLHTDRVHRPADICPSDVAELLMNLETGHDD